MSKKRVAPKKGPRPSYPKPSKELIRESLEDAAQVGYEGGGWELVPLWVGAVPRAEDIELTEEHEALVHAWETNPERIPPIVIQAHAGIMDGYHRHDAAIRAGHEYIWAIVI